MGLILGGLIFLGTGGLVGLTFIFLGLNGEGLLVSTIGIGVLLIFGGIGVGMLISALKEGNRRNNIIVNGQKYEAKIVDYRDGAGVVVNGVPPLDIVVDCMYNGERRQFVIPTGSNSERKYPLGAYCQIAVFENEVALVPNSVRL